MDQVKKYFAEWTTMRYIRLVLGLIFGLLYLIYRQEVLIYAGGFLTIQAILNLSCPGGSCATNVSESDKKVMNIEKYKPENN